MSSLGRFLWFVRNMIWGRFGEIWEYRITKTRLNLFPKSYPSNQLDCVYSDGYQFACVYSDGAGL